MDTTADAEDVHEGSDADADAEQETVAPSPEHETLTGLHAKIYVADAGRQGHIWTGSANATDAAFNKNVEFLVELVGSKRKCGVDVFLGSDEDATKFRRLLIPFSPRGDDPPDETERQLEQDIDNARMLITNSDCVAQVASGDDPDTFRLELELNRGVPIAVPSEVELKCWPITLPEDRDGIQLKSIIDGATFDPVSFEALTSFFAFRIVAQREEKSRQQTFVFNVPLIGAPENRHDRLLLNVLHNKSQVLRYLLLLLADDGTAIGKVLDEITKPDQPGSTGNASDPYSVPLLEPLVRALAQDPEKLDRVNRLVSELRTTEDGTQRLPDDFDEIWKPIWQVRCSLNGDSE
jgi:hypothetical protein